MILEGLLGYIVLFICQLTQAWFRSWNIRSLGIGDKWGARISWFSYGVVWLLSLAIGIKAMMEGDWIGIAIWFIGSMIGQEIAMMKNKKK